MNAPKKIWVWDYAADQMVNDKPDSTDVMYVRGDIVEEMQRAMVAYMERFPSVFGAPYKVVDDYKKAIKLLEEE